MQQHSKLKLNDRLQLHSIKLYILHRWIKVPIEEVHALELVSKELNHLAAILHVYAGGLNFMK